MNLSVRTSNALLTALLLTLPGYLALCFVPSPWATYTLAALAVLWAVVGVLVFLNEVDDDEIEIGGCSLIVCWAIAIGMAITPLARIWL